MIQPRKTTKEMRLTTRRPGHNNTPLLQRRTLRKIRHQIRAIKQKIRNILLLPNLPTNNRLQQQLTRIRDLARSNKTRSQRRKGIKALREPPLRDTSRERRVALQLARGNIVTDCIRCYV
jgi:hypothetical protein